MIDDGGGLMRQVVGRGRGWLVVVVVVVVVVGGAAAAAGAVTHVSAFTLSNMLCFTVVVFVVGEILESAWVKCWYLEHFSLTVSEFLEAFCGLDFRAQNLVIRMKLLLSTFVGLHGTHT